MSRQHVVCIAGLSQDLLQRVRSISAKRIAPTGHVILKALPSGGYSDAHAAKFIEDAAAWIRQQKEATPVSVVLIYVRHRGGATEKFVARFFPFALGIPVAPVDLSGVTDKPSMNTACNKYIERLIDASTRARKHVDAISHHLKDEHRRPALLPVRNFDVDELRATLRQCFANLGEAADASAYLNAQFGPLAKKLEAKIPDSGQRCFSDGHLFFLGPGKARHGYFRHQAKGHRPECLLSARSRLGGSFAFDFHYDCQPVEELKSEYPNCHDANEQPKPTHVNIAPNDYVI